MRLQTASEGIAFAKGLEQDSKELYELLGERFSKHADLFRAFAAENEKNWKNTQRAYYGVISDAIEGSYSFDLDSDAHAIEAGVPDRCSMSEAVDVAVRVEKVVAGFYEEAARQSEGLLADVPRVFRQMAKRHRKRIAELEAFR
jgi:rubrerythrin